jgi:hypothetical protein
MGHCNRAERAGTGRQEIAAGEFDVHGMVSISREAIAQGGRHGEARRYMETM